MNNAQLRRSFAAQATATATTTTAVVVVARELQRSDDLSPHVEEGKERGDGSQTKEEPVAYDHR